MIYKMALLPYQFVSLPTLPPHILKLKKNSSSTLKKPHNTALYNNNFILTNPPPPPPPPPHKNPTPLNTQPTQNKQTTNPLNHKQK